MDRKREIGHHLVPLTLDKIFESKHFWVQASLQIVESCWEKRSFIHETFIIFVYFVLLVYIHFCFYYNVKGFSRWTIKKIVVFIIIIFFFIV